MKNAKQQLILNKGVENFIFRYEYGQESELLDVLSEQAEDSRTSFDWLDAAILSFVLMPSLTDRIDEFLSL